MASEKNFSATVDAWARETDERLLAVFQTAVQELFFGVLKVTGEGGRMRVKTGFLRSSFQASLNAPILLNLENPNPDADYETFTLDGGAISLTIAGANIGDTVYGMFTANYARPREFKDGFVKTNVAMWQDYVDDAVLTVKNAVNGN